MNRSKPAKGTRDHPIEDAALLRGILQALATEDEEFQIRVEGTSTLPYAARVQGLDAAEGLLLVRLVRPLPHELPEGALFRMLFTAEGQRFEGLTAFRGRSAYLQYAFDAPRQVFYADRRQHKRQAFRPRESAYVIAQDGGIPGHGIAGALVNLGMGGVAMRVDRLLRLDDGMRVPVNTAFFERGKALPKLRLQDLPRLPLLELRGRVAHVVGRGSELILGLAFGEMDEGQAGLLGDSLAFREKLFQASRSGSGLGPPPAPGGGGAEEPPSPPERAAQEPSVEGAEVTPADPLRALRRRSARLLLVMAPGPSRERLEALLAAEGCLRLEHAASPEVACALLKAEDPRPRPALLLVDLALAGLGDAEPLAALRVLERRIGAPARLPMVVLCPEVDPTLLLVQPPHLRVLPFPEGPGGDWIGSLEELLSPA